MDQGAWNEGEGPKAPSIVTARRGRAPSRMDGRSAADRRPVMDALFEGFEPPAEKKPEPTTPTVKFTERMMLDALAARYAADSGNGPRYVYAEHVRNQGGFGGYDPELFKATGKRSTLRTADAMAIDLWPSSGNVIHGFEVKVSRSDWLTELGDPLKAEAFKRYVHHWWLVVPDASIVRDDLPDGWGLLTLDRFDRIHVRRSAPKLAPEPMPLGLTAAWLRAAVKTARRAA